MRRPILIPLAALAALCLLSTSALAGKKDLDDHLKKAVEVLREVGGDVPAHLRKDSQCISVMTIGKGGFIVGGSGGRGFLTCRSKGGSAWSAPVVLDIGGGSAGAQIGGAKIELVMVFTDVDDIDQVAHATPVFQGSATATAGDQGVGASAGGNPGTESGVFTFSRSEGLYAGATGEALVVDPDEAMTEKLLGTRESLENILVKRTVAVPPKAKDFIAAVHAWSKGG